MFSRQKQPTEDTFIGHETRSLRRPDALQEEAIPQPPRQEPSPERPAPVQAQPQPPGPSHREPDPVRARAATMAPSRSGPASIISADLKVSGALLTDGVIELFGEVDGPIYAREVTIGASARIAGEVVAETAIIDGPCSGRVTARRVHLKTGARFSGDIIHQTLVVEEGAEFEGAVHRKVDEAAWADITRTFEEPGVELTAEAAEAVESLKQEFLRA